MKLRNKTIAITGRSSGIGAEVARLARFEGARMIGIDRNDPTLSIDDFIKADLSTPDLIDALWISSQTRSTRLRIGGVIDTACRGSLSRPIPDH